MHVYLQLIQVFRRKGVIKRQLLRIFKFEREARKVNYMKTYVEVFVSSEGMKASEILDILTNIGFKPSFGEQDFVYHWKKK